LSNFGVVLDANALSTTVGLAHLGHELDVIDLWVKHQLRYTASPLHLLSDSSCQCNVIYRRYEGIWLTLDTPPLIRICVGADLFVLHRDDSSASAASHRRPIHSPPEAPDFESARRQSMAINEEASTPVPDFLPSPVVIIHPPPEPGISSSKCSITSPIDSNEVDCADNPQEASEPALNIPPSPIRVVYSPTVRRDDAVGYDRRSSIVADDDVGMANNSQLLPQDGIFVDLPATTSSPSLEEHAYPRRRHNSTASNREDKISTSEVYASSRQKSNTTNLEAGIPGGPVAPSSEILQENRTALLAETYHEEEESLPRFRAFPQRKWLRPIIIAKVVLAIVTCSVLGNFIYT